ncbi:MAG: PIG-L family deacetylase [Bryobacteraceae bacterium]
MTRKEFLLTVTAAATASPLPYAPKILLIVAHPDDEYTFAATVYRATRDLHATVDQVVITNGAGGYRYSQLAERFYHTSLTNAGEARAHLPEIRKKETIAAGRILGIRRHYFLEQKDASFTQDRGEAFRDWDIRAVSGFLTNLLEREHYDFVFTILPTPETHGHHKAAALLAVRAVQQLPEASRPVVLGGDPARSTDAPGEFDGAAPIRFTRTQNDQIVVNWVIAEHKSQGLFQTDYNKHDEERFWILKPRGGVAAGKTQKLFHALESANN